MASVTYHKHTDTGAYSVEEAKAEGKKSAWEETLDREYPGAIPEGEFVNYTQQVLRQYGFEARNTLSCVSLCRDELCAPLADLIDQAWRNPFLHIPGSRVLNMHSFVLSSLAGMLFLGTTGMGAAVSHAPLDGNKQRFVFYAMPHIGIDHNGILGEVDRPGIAKSHACGALFHLLDDILKETLDFDSDPSDIEYSLLKQRVMAKLLPNLSPNTKNMKIITDVTQKVIHEDLVSLIDNSIVKEKTDYAVFTAIQIHTPIGESYIYLKDHYVVIGSGKTKIELPPYREYLKTLQEHKST